MFIHISGPGESMPHIDRPEDSRAICGIERNRVKGNLEQAACHDCRLLGLAPDVDQDPTLGTAKRNSSGE